MTLPSPCDARIPPAGKPADDERTTRVIQVTVHGTAEQAERLAKRLALTAGYLTGKAEVL